MDTLKNLKQKFTEEVEEKKKKDKDKEDSPKMHKLGKPDKIEVDPDYRGPYAIIPQ